MSQSSDPPSETCRLWDRHREVRCPVLDTTRSSRPRRAADRCGQPLRRSSARERRSTEACAKIIGITSALKPGSFMKASRQNPNVSDVFSTSAVRSDGLATEPKSGTTSCDATLRFSPPAPAAECHAVRPCRRRSPRRRPTSRGFQRPAPGRCLGLGEERRRLQHRFQIVDRDGAGVLERGPVGDGRSDHRSSVRHRRLAAGLAVAGLVDDQRLAGVARLACGGQEAVAVLDPFQQADDRPWCRRLRQDRRRNRRRRRRRNCPPRDNAKTRSRAPCPAARYSPARRFARRYRSDRVCGPCRHNQA